VYVERTPDGARRIADIVRVDETLGSDGGFITSPLLDD